MASSGDQVSENRFYEFSSEEVIGVGGFGKVYLVKQNGTDFECCVKHINLNQLERFVVVIFFFICYFYYTHEIFLFFVTDQK